jgi:single-strand DNA-binding protein
VFFSFFVLDMRNINKVILIGNVSRPPEVRVTSNKQKMTTFVIATNRTWYNPHGKKQSQAEFHNVLAWGKISDICQKFLQKSTLVYVEGYLKTRNWENEDGIRFYRTEIIIQDILVLDRGMRHDESPPELDIADEPEFDFEKGVFEDSKPPSVIEKSFQKKLSKGNKTLADTVLGEEKDSSQLSSSVSLDEPLFEEEAK